VPGRTAPLDWAVESREHTVTRALDPAAATDADLGVAQIVMAVEDVAPCGVADTLSARGGVDDLGEENRCESS
jgi:hypothetical protein